MLAIWRLLGHVRYKSLSLLVFLIFWTSWEPTLALEATLIQKQLRLDFLVQRTLLLWAQLFQIAITFLLDVLISFCRFVCLKIVLILSIREAWLVVVKILFPLWDTLRLATPLLLWRLAVHLADQLSIDELRLYVFCFTIWWSFRHRCCVRTVRRLLWNGITSASHSNFMVIEWIPILRFFLIMVFRKCIEDHTRVFFIFNHTLIIGRGGSHVDIGWMLQNHLPLQITELPTLLLVRCYSPLRLLTIVWRSHSRTGTRIFSGIVFLETWLLLVTQRTSLIGMGDLCIFLGIWCFLNHACCDIFGAGSDNDICDFDALFLKGLIEFYAVEGIQCLFLNVWRLVIKVDCVLIRQGIIWIHEVFYGNFWCQPIVSLRKTIIICLLCRRSSLISRVTWMNVPGKFLNTWRSSRSLPADWLRQ